MRILLVSNVFLPGFIGGYELGAWDVAQSLIARGHELLVVTSQYFVDDTAGFDSLPVSRVLDCPLLDRAPREAEIRMDGASYVSAANIRRLAGEIAQFRPDSILCFNLAGLGALGILKFLVGAGFRPVLYLMDNVFGGFDSNGELKARFLRTFGADDYLAEVEFVYISQLLISEVVACLGIRPRREHIVPGWAAVTAALQPKNARADAAAAPSDVRRFLYASRIAGHKGINLVLEAAHSLVARGEKNFRIDIFGNGQIPEMLQNIVAYGLQENVVFKGSPSKPELLLLFRDYDAFVFPTNGREPFGFVVSEAAAAGCLPIMTKGIGAAEWYLHNIDCIKIDRSVDDVCAAMLSLIYMPRNELDAMRINAQRTTRRLLDPERSFGRIELLLAGAKTPEAFLSVRQAEAATTILAEVWRSTADV